MFFGDSEAYNFLAMVAAETEEKGATRRLALRRLAIMVPSSPSRPKGG